MNVYEHRIDVAKKAVKTVRDKTDYGFRVLQPPVIMSTPKEWAFGVIGILDFVATGNADKILIHEVRGEVKKLLGLEKVMKRYDKKRATYVKEVNSQISHSLSDNKKQGE
jgi:hypothetical protein